MYNICLIQYESKLADVLTKQLTHENKLSHLITFTSKHKQLLKEKEQLIEKIKSFLDKQKDTLCDREKVILEDRLLQDDSRSLKNIAEQFDISRERIRQIEARLLKKIGKTLRQEMPDIAVIHTAA